MHPSHGQVRANIVQLNTAHIKLEPMISALQPPWSSQVPQSQRCFWISSDILPQTNSTVSFRKAQPNRWVLTRAPLNEAPEPKRTLTKLDCMFMN